MRMRIEQQQQQPDQLQLQLQLGGDVGDASVEEMRMRWTVAATTAVNFDLDELHVMLRAQADAINELRAAVVKLERDVGQMQEYVHARFQGLANKVDTLCTQ